jgi:sugar/nucleoside kinase (ribokinase family)
MMADVLSLGEILVDWVCTTTGAELDRAETFTKAPGGAPANVAVGCARQGIKTAFLGRLSTDAFGQWLKAILEEEGIDTTGTVIDSQAQTRMAYVVTTATGDRKLAEFSKISVADAQYSPNDVNAEQFLKAKVLHFGSISLIESPSKEATTKAVELAHENKLLVSYDPNVRIGLWPTPDACRQTILNTLKWADFVKLNLGELEFLTGSKDFNAARRLRQEHDLPLLIVTLDSHGAHIITDNSEKTVPGVKIQLVEATGAGDGFVSGIISGLLLHVGDAKNRQQALSELPIDTLTEIVRRANAVGALACTRAGAIPALPRKSEIDSFIESLAAAI